MGEEFWKGPGPRRVAAGYGHDKALNEGAPFVPQTLRHTNIMSKGQRVDIGK